MVYKSSQSKFKGSGRFHFVTYDLPMTMRFRDGSTARKVVPKVHKVFVSGKLAHWVHHKGEVTIEYVNPVEAFVAHRGATAYHQPRKDAMKTIHVAVPANARNVVLRTSLPEKYKSAEMAVK